MMCDHYEERILLFDHPPESPLAESGGNEEALFDSRP